MITFLLNKAPTDLASILRQANVTVWTTMSELPAQAIGNFAWNALERVDAIVLEIAYPTDELNFILAQAIVLQKPTLCLFPKHREPHVMLNHLHKPNVPKSVITKCYTATTINEILAKFLQSIDRSVSIAENPTIKFTLRLTPAIDHYLNWLAHYKQLNKADYIRKLLKDDAEQNADYQKLL